MDAGFACESANEGNPEFSLTFLSPCPMPVPFFFQVLLKNAIAFSAYLEQINRIHDRVFLQFRSAFYSPTTHKYPLEEKVKHTAIPAKAPASMLWPRP